MLLQNIGNNDLLSEGNILCQGNGCIVILFVVVHPHFCSPACIASKYITRASGERIWMLFAEDMSNP